MPSQARRPRRPRLGADFGPLEDRSVPAQFGIPWPDAGHLTLSFAPDGTPTPAGPSQAGTALAAAPGWQREVLRAFQTWAVNTNLNVGLVADGGQPLGAVGAIQGDKRFGDVRVAAAPVAGDTELAFASPFTWAGSTFSGDVIIDTANRFAVGDTPAGADVFTVAAHEAGHALGLDHSAEAGSVRNETYTFRTGLSAGDVAAVKGLYGARSPDAYDAKASNGTAAAASPVPVVPNTDNRQLMAVGDVTAAGDVDYYKVKVPSGTTSLVGRLKVTGESLLLARYTITNVYGQVIGSGAATDPTSNDLTFQFDSPVPGDYFVRVEGASKDVFGVGGYRLVVDLTTAQAPKPAPLPKALPVTDGGTNNTLATATKLDPKNQTDSRFDASYQGASETPTDGDYYKVHSSKMAGGVLAMNVVVWGTDADPLSPMVHVYDEKGQPVAFQVLANDAGVVSVRVASVTPDKDYYVQVMARAPGGLGSYFMGVDFNQYAFTPYQAVAAGTLAAGGAAAGGLTVAQSGVYQFAVSAALAGTGGGSVAMDLVDATGATVTTLTAAGNQPSATRAQYLPAGTYTVVYRHLAPAAGAAAPVRYTLFLQALSDPIGPRPTGVTSSAGDTKTPIGVYVYAGASDVLATGLPAVF